MTQHDLYPCRKSACWIPRLLDKGYEALWPLYHEPELSAGMFVWTFHVRWKGRRNTKVNKVRLCEKHHKQMLSIQGAEMASDVREQEATDRWLTAVNSQVLACLRSY